MGLTSTRAPVTKWSMADEIRRQLRRLVISSLACAAAAAACLIIGTIADNAALDQLNKGHHLGRTNTPTPITPSLTNGWPVPGFLDSTVEGSMYLHEGRTYVLAGSSYFMDATATVSITSATGTKVPLVPATGNVRSMSVIGTFSVPESGEYQLSVSSRAIYISCSVYDDSIRGYDAAAAVLLPSGLVILGVAFVLFLAWGVKKEQWRRDQQAAADMAKIWVPPED